MSPWEGAQQPRLPLGVRTAMGVGLGKATWTREPRSNHSTQHLASEGQDSLSKVTPPARDLGSPKSGWATCRECVPPAQGCASPPQVTPGVRPGPNPRTSAAAVCGRPGAREAGRGASPPCPSPARSLDPRRPGTQRVEDYV